jgi:hypothetical protein
MSGLEKRQQISVDNLRMRPLEGGWPGCASKLPIPSLIADAVRKSKEGQLMSKSEPEEAKSPSQLIDERISELGDWHGEMLARLRALIRQAEPEVVEEWKWRGVPVWYRDGMICTGETYKRVVKMTFAKGAALDDPSSLFNASLEGSTRRAIDFHEGEEIDEEALKALVRAAVALNRAKPPRRSR